MTASYFFTAIPPAMRTLEVIKYWRLSLNQKKYRFTHAWEMEKP